MLLKAMQLAVNSTFGVPKGMMGGEFKGINYKPNNKTMKKFKHVKLAVKGDSLELMKFEKALQELGYENTGGRGDVFDYRGSDGSEKPIPATYITIGLHYGSDAPGMYTPACNDGGGIIYKLPLDFDKALRLASQLEPLFVTKDGVEITDGDCMLFGARPITKCENPDIKDVYKNHYLSTTRYKCGVPSFFGWFWFSSESARKKYIDSITPILTTEDGVKKNIGDQVWYVRPNFSYHFWKSGIKDDVS